MAKQIISLIVIFAMVSLYPANLLAQETDSAPKLTDVKEGDIVPFDGVLLNSRAAIQMLAYKRNAALDCKINTDYELEKQKAKNVLLNDSIRLSLDSIIEIKDNEIARLNDLVVEASSTNVEWWVAGGFLVGTAVSLGIFFAAAEAGK